MIQDTINVWNSPVRSINGIVELLKSSTATASGEVINLKDVNPKVHKIECKVRSKNLISFPYVDNTKVASGITFTVNEDGSITINGTATARAIFYLIRQDTKYNDLLKNNICYFSSGQQNENIQTIIEYYNSSNTWQKAVNGGKVDFTNREIATISSYIAIVAGATIDNVTIYPQLEIGTTATSYAPYIADFSAVTVSTIEQTKKASPDGIVEGLYSIADNMRITSNTTGVIIDVKYNSYKSEDFFLNSGELKSFSIERVGEESKFFGYGICQKSKMNLVNKNGSINIDTNNFFNTQLTASYLLINPTPYFYVTEVHKDENTNELSIIGYDALYKATEHTFAELGLEGSYLIEDVASACASLLGVKGIAFIGVTNNEYWRSKIYYTGANFDGTETIREVLDAVAEATQTIYYINNENILVFKRLGASESILTITKSDYITLESKTNRTITSIVSATELGDNVEASLGVSGDTQYVRNNPFWELEEDVAAMVEDALANVGGLTVPQFTCTWRGNFALELGDAVTIINKDDTESLCFILNDTIEYEGGLSQVTSWNYTESAETVNNPSSLGEALKKTYARVDKANKEIELVAAEATQLKLEAEGIKASVSNLDSQVSAKMSAEEVQIEIEKQMVNGANKVITSTGFTFDNEGLKITKTDSEINTSITEDGMTVYKNNSAVLTANNQGVKAVDLHATTYLIIGNNSRFEDFDSGRTGCFWIG